MNSDLRSWKTQITLKFLQEITKFSSNPLIRTLTSESLTSFQLTLKNKNKIRFFTLLGVLLPNFIFSTTTIKLSCWGQDEKLIVTNLSHGHDTNTHEDDTNTHEAEVGEKKGDWEMSKSGSWQQLRIMTEI